MATDQAEPLGLMVAEHTRHDRRNAGHGPAASAVERAMSFQRAIDLIRQISAKDDGRNESLLLALMTEVASLFSSSPVEVEDDPFPNVTAADLDAQLRRLDEGIARQRVEMDDLLVRIKSRLP